MKTQEETAHPGGSSTGDRLEFLPYELSSLVSGGSLSSLRTDFERVMRMNPTTTKSMATAMKIVPKVPIIP